MRTEALVVVILCTALATPWPLSGTPLVLEGLDPTIFGSVLDLSTRRIVNSGQDLQAYLSDATVSTLLLNDSVILSSDFWTRTVIIKQRAVQIISAGSDRPAIDLGGLVDAIHVDSTGVLGMHNIATRNAGPRAIVRLDTRARLKAGNFGAWPSITLDPDARVVVQNSTLYTYSQRAWQQCALFQKSAASFLERSGYTGNYSSSGQTELYINDRWTFRSYITDLTTNQTVGAAYLEYFGASVVCQPDPFLGLSMTSRAGVENPAQAGGSNSAVPWWGGLLCGLGALFAVVVLVWLALHIIDRRASRKAGAAPDAEKGHKRQASRHVSPKKKEPCDCGSNEAHGDSLEHKAQRMGSTGSESLTGNESSRDDGLIAAEMPAPSSHCASMTDAVMSLPDILRARSAQLVGSLELGAPLGRGSYGKVYKGKWKGTTVAVKILEHSAESSSGIKELRESVLSSSIIHPNVVSTYKIRTIPAACPPSCLPYPEGRQGIDAYQSDPTEEKAGRKPSTSTYGPEMLETWLLLEFCDRGTLERAIMQTQSLSLPSGDPNLEFMYRCLIDIAVGMDYLHSLGVINGDLKPANVLLKSTNADARGFTCKLADFGLSRVLDTDRTHVSTQTYGTLAYQPAELLQEGKLTKAVDVHSFSMIMYEMYTRKRTFDGCNTGQAFYKILMGFRPSLPPDMPAGYRSVMKSCWAADPAARPSFEVVICCLQDLLQAHLQEVRGMHHTATIDRPFSDERAIPPAEKAAAQEAENAAFLTRIQAATREAHSDPTQPPAERRPSFSKASIVPIPEGQEACIHAARRNTFSNANSWLGREEMGHDMGPRVNSWEMHHTQSGASSFDEQLWEELEAQARRRRSAEGTVASCGPEPRPGACMAASPFARQLAETGAPGLFGPQTSPLPSRPSAPPASRPAGPPAALASPFAAGQHPFMARPAVYAAGWGDGPAMTGLEGQARHTDHPLTVQLSSSSKHTLQHLQNGHAGRPGVLPGSSHKSSPPTSRRSSAEGAQSAAGRQLGTAASAPAQEAMGIDELAALSRRPKRRLVLQHNMAEMLAALDANGPSSHNSSASSAQISGGFQGAAAATAAPFPKAVSEGANGGSLGMSALMDIKYASQSVPELPPQAPRPGAGCMSRSQAQMANEQVVSQVLRKKIRPGAKASGTASRLSPLLQSALSSMNTYKHEAPAPAPALSEGPPAKKQERTVTLGSIEDFSERSHASSPPLPSELLQEGVQSMGGALEVKPSAFGGFTVREDYVGSIRLRMSHARSMPAEGASRTELEVIGRSGGPSAGNKCPATANMHPCKQGLSRPIDGRLRLEDLKGGGRSLPSGALIKMNSAVGASRFALSLGPLPLNRRDLMLAANSGGSNAATTRAHNADEEDEPPRANPFTSFAA